MSDQQQPVGRAGRYQRSIAGGVGSLIVLVVVVLAFVALPCASSATTTRSSVEPVDYLAVVAPAQEAGIRIVYPPSLPEGWTATSVDFVPGARPAFGVGMLTDDGPVRRGAAGGRRPRHPARDATSTPTPRRATW